MINLFKPFSILVLTFLVIFFSLSDVSNVFANEIDTSVSIDDVVDVVEVIEPLIPISSFFEVEDQPILRNNISNYLFDFVGVNEYNFEFGFSLIHEKISSLDSDFHYFKSYQFPKFANDIYTSINALNVSMKPVADLNESLKTIITLLYILVIFLVSVVILAILYFCLRVFMYR